jgi:hypothetical protein
MSKMTHRTNLIIVVKVIHLDITVIASIVITIWLEWTRFLLVQKNFLIESQLWLLDVYKI